MTNLPWLVTENVYLEKQLKKVSKPDTHDHSVPQIDLSKYPVSLLNYSSYTIYEFIIFKAEKFSAQEFSAQNFYTSLLKPPQSIS